MDLSIIITLIFFTLLVCGGFIGFARGFIKSSLRIVWILISCILAYFLSKSFVPLVFKINLSFLGLEVNGERVATLNEFLTGLLQLNGGSAQYFETFMEYATSIVNVIVGGVLFLICYWVIKLLTLPISAIVNALLRVKKWGKPRRFLGFLVGCVSAVIAFSITLAPVTGYLNVVQEANKSLKESGANIPQVEKFDSYVNDYKSSLPCKIYTALGIENLQIGIFNGVTTVQIGDTKISLTEQAKTVGEIVGSIIYIVQIDFEEIESGNEQIEEDELVTHLVNFLNNEIVRSGYNSLAPIVVEALDEIAEKENDEILESAVNVLKDGIENVYNISEANLKIALENLVELVDSLLNIDERDLSTVNYSSIGKNIDQVVASGLVSSTAMNEFAICLCDVLIEENQSNDQIVDLLQNIKEGFASDSLNYESEFTAVGKLVPIIDIVSDGIDFENEGAQIGACLDQAVAVNATVINEGLINGFVIDLIDQFTADITQDQPFYSSIASIKNTIEQGGLNYQSEFNALSKVLSLAEELTAEFNFESNGEQVGEKLDQIVAMQSKLVSKQLISDFIVQFIDKSFSEITAENEFYDSLVSIKNQFASGVNSYQTEFSAIAKLLSVKDFINEEFDFTTNGAQIGEKIDQALAINSQIVTQEFINGYIGSALEGHVQVDDNWNGTVEMVKGRLSDIQSYQSEFECLQILLESTQQTISLSNINQKFVWPDQSEQTVAQRLDSIAHSKLVGDVGLIAIENILNDYSNDNPTYSNITDCVKQNFATVKQNAKVCGKTEGHTYQDITSAFSDLYLQIGSQDKITDNSAEFSVEIASHYELMLNDLQGNLIVGENGARAIALNVTTAVKTFVSQKQSQLGSYAYLLDELLERITAYQNYLSRTTNLQAEPYSSESALYVISGDGFNQNFAYETFAGSTPYGAYVRVNKPFSFFFEELEKALQNAI